MSSFQALEVGCKLMLMSRISEGDTITIALLIGIFKLSCCHHNVVCFSRRGATHDGYMYIGSFANTYVQGSPAMRANALQAPAPKPAQSGQLCFTGTAVSEHAINTRPQPGMLGMTCWTNIYRNGHVVMTIRARSEEHTSELRS